MQTWKARNGLESGSISGTSWSVGGGESARRGAVRLSPPASKATASVATAVSVAVSAAVSVAVSAAVSAAVSVSADGPLAPISSAAKFAPRSSAAATASTATAAAALASSLGFSDVIVAVVVASPDYWGRI